MSEPVAYWLFGVALSCALTFAVGRTLVAERGRNVIPALAAFALPSGYWLGGRSTGTSPTCALRRCGFNLRVTAWRLAPAFPRGADPALPSGTQYR